MAGTIIAVTALAIAATQCARNLRREKRPVSKRVDKISDAALAEILRLFPERAADDRWRRRVDDERFVDAIVAALSDRALTPAQIRRLFNHTYTVGADRELKRYFGWNEALREAVEVAEEEASRPPAPPPPPAPRPKLPPISDADFGALTKEWPGLPFSEGIMCVDEWCGRFSFSLTQRSELLSMTKNYTNKNGQFVDCGAIRNAIRSKMQIHEPDTAAAKFPGAAS